MIHQHKKVTRRSFVRSATAGVAAAHIVAPHVLGGPGKTAPSDKLNIAGIGVGGRGAACVRGVESENIVALADRVRTLLGEFEPAAEGEGEAEAAATAVASRRGPPKGPPMMSGLTEDLYKSEGARLSIVADRSLFIESSISEVRNTAVLGGILAIFILYLFLRNFKTTTIIAVSIPISACF